MSEHDEDDDSYEDEIYEVRSGRSGYGGGGASGRRSARGDRQGTRRERDRERSASRDRSLSPRSERHSVSSNLASRPAKVTLVKSRKNEGWFHNVRLTISPSLFIVELKCSGLGF